MAEAKVHQLSSVTLPAESRLRRDLPSGTANPTHEGWQRYDRRTLIYDAFLAPGGRHVQVHMPRLFNLSGLLAQTKFKSDGVDLRHGHHRIYRRHETLELIGLPDAPRQLQVEVPGLAQQTFCLHADESAPFAGRNAICTMLRNDQLDWITDWMRFHHKVHGADAVLLIDNGSDAYYTADLARAIASVPGYLIRQVISAPLPHGPRVPGKGGDRGKFLQTAMLNLMRDRFLAKARGMLNVDIDELLLTHHAQSVFDRVQRLGYLTFPGTWRFVGSHISQPRHVDHVYANPARKPCPGKYCIRPGSFLGRRELAVHSLAHLNRRLFKDARHFEFLHCRSISTSWKYDRDDARRETLVVDKMTQQILHDTLSSQDN